MLLLPLRLRDLAKDFDPTFVVLWLVAGVGSYAAAVACALAVERAVPPPQVRPTAAMPTPTPAPLRRLARAGLIVALALLPAVLIRNTVLGDWVVRLVVP